jgi:hypothetical protein
MGNKAPLFPVQELTTRGIAGEAEEAKLDSLNEWIDGQGLPRGEIAFDYADPSTGAHKAMFDLAWPEGLQAGLTAPVAVLMNGSADLLAMANGAGYRCFTSTAEFRKYVETEVLHVDAY